MPLQNGDTFAGYTIVRTLGAGGMGEVYLFRIKFALCPTAIRFRGYPASLLRAVHQRNFHSRSASRQRSLIHKSFRCAARLDRAFSASTCRPVTSIPLLSPAAKRLAAYGHSFAQPAVLRSMVPVVKWNVCAPMSATPLGATTARRSSSTSAPAVAREKSEDVLVAAQRMMARQPGDIGRVVKQS
jgi:hypothetical protein